jgi:hypothetical protein
MKEVNELIGRRETLKKGILANLDMLMGSIVKAPTHSGHYLTDKVDGKTVTRYIRKNMLKKAGDMTVNHRRLRQMARELSKVNFELLRRGAL